MINNRKLDSNEQSMEILNRCAGSFNVLTISRIKGELSEEILSIALNLVQKRHPRLKSRITGTLDNLCFEDGTEKIPLRVVEQHYSEQYVEVVVEELNKPIESDKGLARVVLINSSENINYLITILHHAICDGLSTVQLHSEILTYCNKIAAGQIEDNLKELPPLPNIQKLFPKSMQGNLGLIKTILSLVKFKFKRVDNRPQTMSFEKCVPIESRSTGMVCRKLDKNATTQLITACQNKKTTVQGALCAALLFAVARIIRDGNKENLLLSCHSSIDLRRRLEPQINRENLGVLALGFTSLHNVDINTHFWDLARDLKRQLEVGLKSEDIFTNALMSRKMYESLLSRPYEVPVTVAVTNIGRVDITDNYGLFKLEEISFVSSQAVFGGVLGVAVTTFQETMILNFYFSKPSISQERSEILANDMIHVLTDACNKESIVV